MRGRKFSLPKFGAISFCSMLSTSAKAGSSCNASSGTLQRDVQPLMTRHKAITCPSTTNDDVSETLSHTTPPAPHHSLDDDQGGKAHTSARLFEDDNGEDVDTEVGHETMTDSAFIAHNYRLSLSQQCSEMPNHTICPEAPGPIDSDTSCSQPRPAMWDPTAGTDDVFHDQDEKLATQTNTSYQLHDMLCSVPPFIVDGVIEDTTGHDILKSYRRSSRTIVIDSHRPELAPHIVITPPPDTWDALNVAENNRAGYQTMPNLTVPPFYRSTCRMHTYEELMVTFYPTLLPEENGTQWNAPIRTPGARTVFNHSAFRRLVKHTEHERQFHFTRDICVVIQRRLCKVAAITASLKAEEFRTRYESCGFLGSIEKPYKWTDPADPILSDLGKYHTGVHTIHSVNPFVAPHIVIHETSASDPWIYWANATDPQDSSSGNFLVVPSKGPTLTEDGKCDVDDELDRQSYMSDPSSRCDSPFPETPQDLQRLGSGFFSDTVEEDIADNFQQGYLDYPSVTDEEDTSLLPADQLEYRSSSTYGEFRESPKNKFFILDEDEDDGPPEFDEWFISIAKRTREAEEIEATTRSGGEDS
ncbi:hypothetical protein GALMADRAFT_236543 [Galerina marginata CBS 339.88]|uniref:Uncharacterized protein n=1 Tax=Galerina marginata (strain CBS 339.88) TaxID=685588 RepID=A0A067TLI2_GALM3|nr:hypothetical protein GALMADRAFT_236543 [Galerina marginata CBS 339.88]